ncbi:MAG: hypothetical protein KGP29_05030 [Proteobacteria bacterium]|nr:hypothetical protein [Pseudomonadota bacterium]
MKKTFLFLLLFSKEVWALDYSNQGILNDVIGSDSKFFLNLEPKLTHRLIAESQLEDNYKTTSKRDEYEYKEITGKIRFYSNLQLNKNLSINSYVLATRLDNANDVPTGKNRYFENFGAYFQELTLNSNHENYSLVAGKFNLGFGSAWRFDRGLWSYNIASNYRQTEKLGFSGVYRLGDSKKTGQYNFSFSTFTNDRKNLDNSVFVNRESDQKSNGRPGDTRSLSSYNLGLNVNFDFGKQEKLSYNFSYLNLAVNKRASPVETSKIEDQKGFAAGMNYKYPWKENIAFDLLLEYVEMKNIDGNSDLSEKYLTGNLITRFYKNWNVLIGSSKRKQIALNSNGTTQNITEISFGYDFDKTNFFDRLTLQAGLKLGYNNNEIIPQTQNSLGALLRYYKYF